MTCVIGLRENGKVYIGADSAASRNWEIYDASTKKVFCRQSGADSKDGIYLFGCAGSYRMVQLLRYKLEIPICNFRNDRYIMQYMANDFIEAVRSCLKEGGLSQVDNNVESFFEFLVGFRERLFVVRSDFAVLEHYTPYIAIGSGHRYAMGAMAALKNSIVDPVERITRALEISGEHCNGVRAPFVVVGEKE
jgi:ATP-dependent protease HslVU (ClpYQ) peptidase subunit